MVAMGVGDEDVRHRLAAHGIEQRRDMRLVNRAGIDDGDAAFADDVADRALEGERPGIVAQDAADAGHHLLDLAGREIEGLVEGNVVAHAQADGRSEERGQWVEEGPAARAVSRCSA